MINQFATPCPDRAGNDSYTVEAGKRAPIHVLRSDVFQRLPARHDVDAVADFRITGDGADLRIDKAASQGSNRVGGKLRVGVEGNNHVAFRVTQTKVQRYGFAGVCFGEQTNQGFVPKAFPDDFAGAIGRSVIDYNYFQAWIIGIQQAANCAFDHSSLVERGDDDRYERLVMLSPMLSLAASRARPLRKCQGANKDQPSQTQDDSDYEGPLQEPTAGR